MLTEFAEFRIVCPKCKAETWVASRMCNPIMTSCGHCKRVLVILDNRLLTVSRDFFKKHLMKSFKTIPCGRVLNSLPPQKEEEDARKSEINADNLLDLKNLLNKCEDVSDFVKKI
jgi:hypothetical protein